MAEKRNLESYIKKNVDFNKLIQPKEISISTGNAALAKVEYVTTVVMGAASMLAIVLFIATKLYFLWYNKIDINKGKRRRTMVDYRSGYSNNLVKESQKLVTDAAEPKKQGDPESVTTFSWDSMEEKTKTVKKKSVFTISIVLPIVILLVIAIIVIIGKVI